MWRGANCVIAAGIPQPETSEPRDAAEARQALDEWLDAWHELHPHEAHPMDIYRSAEWPETMPADI